MDNEDSDPQGDLNLHWAYVRKYVFSRCDSYMHLTGMATKVVLPSATFSLIIASTARDARERSELYGREYDQGKVPYNDIYFQQKIALTNFLPFFFPEVVSGLAGLGRT